MKRIFLLPLSIGMLLSVTGTGNAQPLLSIETGVELRWQTATNNTYQPQASPASISSWTNLGASIDGNGLTISLFDPARLGGRSYQILEIVPTSAPASELPINGGFESGSKTVASNWNTGASQPPARTSDDAHEGSFSMRCAITNVAASPGEGILEQNIAAQGGTISGGETYEFSFWAKQLTSGPSYIQQYQLQWLNGSGAIVGGTGLVNFNGVNGVWTQISVPGLMAPETAVNARIFFRFVTGAVQGGHGEVLIDDIALKSNAATPIVPGSTNILLATIQPAAKISWPTTLGIEYQPQITTNLSSESWIDLSPKMIGDGGMKSVLLPMDAEAAFVRIQTPAEVVLPPANLHTIASGSTNAIGLAWTPSATIGISGYLIFYGVSSDELTNSIALGNVSSAIISGLTPGQTYYFSVIAMTPGGQSLAGEATLAAQPDTEVGIVPLFDLNTPLEPATTIETPTALITYVADRARDRHAREDMFSAYDHYLTWYWEERTIAIEIIDRVAKGGSDITFNYTTLTPLGQPEFRAFFRGIGTVAEYHFNLLAPLVGSNQYSATLMSKLPENRPLELGDRIEIEISQFIQAPVHGRNNYYGTAILYVVGQGIVPWQALGPLQDSYPLPEIAWLGGQTTLPYQYSNEPEHRFKQTAGNIAPTNAQPFMLGRRLHHTDFGDGAHSEAGNPIFSEQAGKLGSRFIARSCVECHVNNGRALPPSAGAPMFQTVMKIGSDALGSPHPVLGSVLQPRSAIGAIEGSAIISNYITNHAEYPDGTPYSLRQPTYSFQGITPEFFSARLAPPLVGLGLLEAVSESTIAALADPDDADQDGISGRTQIVIDPETGHQRLGRFTAKAGKARLSHQIASALNTDMGVTTALFPKLDGESTNSAVELSADDLDLMTRYVALLGVGARRDLTNAEALLGEHLFASASCVKCHTPTLTTSAFHPMAELRNQTIRPYTDLLLHDMGPGLADNLGEASATGAEWRTPPLWNIGLTAGVSGGEAYLHDGRARSLEEAILWHGGEAESSKQSFRNLTAPERAALIKFLRSL